MADQNKLPLFPEFGEPSYFCCSNCFDNFGLKRLCEQLGSKNGSNCFYCRQRDGYFVEDAFLLAESFFVKGSIVPADGGIVPNFQLRNMGIEYGNFGFANEHQLEFHNSGIIKEAIFGPDIEQARRIFKQRAQIDIYNYFPKYNQAGRSTHYFRFHDDPELAWIDSLSEVLSVSPKKSIKKGQSIFRIRTNIHPEHFGALIESLDAPPDSLKTEYGRFDSKNTNMFYGSSDLDTCVLECRADVSDKILVGEFQPTRALSLLDLSSFFVGFSAEESDRDLLDEMYSDPFTSRFSEFSKEEDLYRFLDGLMRSRTQRYELSRDLADRIKSANFDGFTFPSFYTTSTNGLKINYCIFGRPVSEGTLELVSAFSLRINRIKLKYDLGPPHFGSNGS